MGYTGGEEGLEERGDPCLLAYRDATFALLFNYFRYKAIKLQGACDGVSAVHIGSLLKQVDSAQRATEIKSKISEWVAYCATVLTACYSLEGSTHSPKRVLQFINPPQQAPPSADLQRGARFALAAKNEGSPPTSILGGHFYLSALFNCASLLLGLAMLASPYAVYKAGWIILVLGLVCIPIVYFYTAVLLKRCLEKHPDVKACEDIRAKAYGETGIKIFSCLLYVEPVKQFKAMLEVSMDVQMANENATLKNQVQQLQMELDEERAKVQQPLILNYGEEAKPEDLVVKPEQPMSEVPGLGVPIRISGPDSPMRTLFVQELEDVKKPEKSAEESKNGDVAVQGNGLADSSVAVAGEADQGTAGLESAPELEPPGSARC